jgi:hypothetical protein
MIGYMLITSILERICKMTKNYWNVQEMTLGLTPLDICSKSKHWEKNGQG